MILFIVGICFAVAAVVVFIIIKMKKKNQIFGFETDKVGELEKKELLSLSEVIEFFKQPTVMKELKSNKDYLGVLIREKNKSGYRVLFCIYSQNENSIKHPLKFVDAEALHCDLLELFGEKDMLVLK